MQLIRLTLVKVYFDVLKNRLSQEKSKMCSIPQFFLLSERRNWGKRRDYNLECLQHDMIELTSKAHTFIKWNITKKSNSFEMYEQSKIKTCHFHIQIANSINATTMSFKIDINASACIRSRDIETLS